MGAPAPCRSGVAGCSGPHCPGCGCHPGEFHNRSCAVWLEHGNVQDARWITDDAGGIRDEAPIRPGECCPAVRDGRLCSFCTLWGGMCVRIPSRAG